VEFGPYVTTITGKSFIGKSWILRALRWAALNKPAGDSYINWDAKRAGVRLVVDNRKIVRARGPSTNNYKLDKQFYEAFGNDVPASITRALNLSDINFQGVNTLGQHEPPFWFCETAGEVSRQLNSIVNLRVIDSTLSNIASEIRKTRITIEVTQEKLSTVIELRKKLAYVRDLDEDLKIVETSYVILQETTHKHCRIADLIKTYTIELKIRKNVLELHSDGSKVLSRGKHYKDLVGFTEILRKLVENGRSLQKGIRARPPSLLPLEKLKEKMTLVKEHVELLQNLIGTVREREELKSQTKTKLLDLTKELKQTVGDRCPLCGRRMKK